MGPEWCPLGLRRGGDRESLLMCSQFQVGGDENVLEVNRGDSCTTRHVPLNGTLSQNDKCYVYIYIYITKIKK